MKVIVAMGGDEVMSPLSKREIDSPASLSSQAKDVVAPLLSHNRGELTIIPVHSQLGYNNNAKRLKTRPISGMSGLYIKLRGRAGVFLSFSSSSPLFAIVVVS